MISTVEVPAVPAHSSKGVVDTSVAPSVGLIGVCVNANVVNKDKTTINWFENQKSTYASVNFDVFGIASTDYHNEMYDYIRDRFSEEKNTDLGISRFDEEFFKQEKKIKKDKPNKGKNNSVTLPTFIRNCIHYPSNKTKNFNKLLIESIEILKTFTTEYYNKE